MPNRDFVNRRIVICERGHEIHESAFEYVDQWGLRRRVPLLENWRCGVCRSGAVKVLLAAWMSFDFREANKISRGDKL
jgi:hypothetical protein